MTRQKFLFISVLLAACFSACSIFGIHFKIHNPRRAGKYPKATEARVLLGNQDSKYRTCYDVKSYLINVDFGKDLSTEKKITGYSRMLAEAKTDIDTFQLDLAANMKIDKMYVGDDYGQRTKIGGIPLQPANFYRKANAVFIVVHIPKGNLFLVTTTYNGEPPEAKKPPWAGGFVRHRDDLKNPWWGVACQEEGASIWWPCKDVVNDEPDSVDMFYKVPAEFTAVGNGILRDTSSAIIGSAGKQFRQETFHWHVSMPINLYDITFYIGKFKLLHDTYYSEVTHDTLQLNHYVLEQHYDQAKTHFLQLKEYLAFYEKTFGPYPWYRDGFKLVESPYAGMEHQTAIAYGNGFKNDFQWHFDYIILHETAHEWWGNAVTATDLADGWIHEGFATYCEALYVEQKYGHDKYLEYLRADRLYIINRRPVAGPYGLRYFDYHDEDMYMKGTWMLHSLRYSVNNDSLFFDILKTFYARFKYKNASSMDFEKLVDEKTGKDYKWFFDQYLRSRFSPELEYYVSDGKLYYRWSKRTVPGFQMNVKCYFMLPDLNGGSTTKTFAISPTADVQVMEEKTFALPGTLSFNYNEFLFKPVENKKLRRATHMPAR